MTHITPRLQGEERQFMGPISDAVEQVKIANEDVEGLLRGFTGGEAAVTAAIGGVTSAALLRVETSNRLVNTGARVLGGLALYVGYKAAERASEVVIGNARRTF